MSMFWHVYETGPIDCWNGWMLLDEYGQRTDHAAGLVGLVEFIAYCHDALEAIGKMSEWEGDSRGREIYVSGLPPEDGEMGVLLAFAVKQDNNGMTYFASPYELPWLKGGYRGKCPRPPQVEFPCPATADRPSADTITECLRGIDKGLSSLMRSGGS